MTQNKKVLIRLSNREADFPCGGEVLGPVYKDFEYVSRSPCHMKVQKIVFFSEGLETTVTLKRSGSQDISLKKGETKSSAIIQRGDFIRAVFQEDEDFRQLSYFHIHIFGEEIL